MNAQQQPGVFVIQPQRVLEGAGVRLQRSLGTPQFNYLDPFLLFDDFSSPNTDDYVCGFPWHPHRGIETVTYILSGQVRHLDSLGNGGTLGAGDVQWMSAGSGIMHEEMPQSTSEPLVGFQLWVNLPAREKMSAPRYQNIPAQAVPTVTLGSGVSTRVVAGTHGGVRGPVTDIAVSPTYLDVALEAGVEAALSLTSGDSTFAYVFQGDIEFRIPEGGATRAAAPRLAVVQAAHEVRLVAGLSGARLLWVAGSPLHEPIARYGPFVMNTREEIQQALEDLQQGTFIRAQPRSDPSQWYGARGEGDGAG
ncbi:MAG: pirin family protein [Chloroflexi bacterium]|nr:pirin family protein [Chloroflexota bacterium]